MQAQQESQEQTRSLKTIIDMLLTGQSGTYSAQHLGQLIAPSGQANPLTEKPSLAILSRELPAMVPDSCMNSSADLGAEEEKTSQEMDGAFGDCIGKKKVECFKGEFSKCWRTPPSTK